DIAAHTPAPRASPSMSGASAHESASSSYPPRRARPGTPRSRPSPVPATCPIRSRPPGSPASARRKTPVSPVRKRLSRAEGGGGGGGLGGPRAPRAAGGGGGAPPPAAPPPPGRPRAPALGAGPGARHGRPGQRLVRLARHRRIVGPPVRQEDHQPPAVDIDV